MVADAEIKFTNKGTAVANFSIAVNRKKGEEETVSYFDCTAWGTLAQGIADNLFKGQRVIITGNLTQDRYENKEGKNVSKVILIVEGAGADLRYASEDNAKATPKKKWLEPEEDF
jgi:single-strand DNA-binding protein